jgi:hypothetical protein
MLAFQYYERFVCLPPPSNHVPFLSILCQILCQIKAASTLLPLTKWHRIEIIHDHVPFLSILCQIKAATIHLPQTKGIGKL